MAKKSTPVAGTLAMPSLLGYKRSIEPTQFAMYALYAKEEYTGLDNLSPATATLRPVKVTAATARGTVANFSSKALPQERVGIEKNAIDGANIQTVESAFLPVDISVLAVGGAVRFSGHVYAPSMHDAPEFVAATNVFLRAYAAQNGFQELALRYMLNLACGRWLWRNWQGDNLQVRLNVKGEGEHLVLQESDVDMGQGFSLEAISAVKRAQFAAMVELVAKTLGTEASDSVVIEVLASVDMGPGAEVYPSQEFGSAEESSRDKGPSKVLARSILADGTAQAVIHPQKVGNAIRTIDTWHGDESAGAIAVEPFGANTHMKRAYRVSGNDLYSYFSAPAKLLEEVNVQVAPQHHFVAACLVRGGAYQMGAGKGE